jgi:hypothetical protein
MTMFLGTTTTGNPFNVEASDLLTHGVVLGRTGSGKTGATVTVIEEAVLSGASVIVLDPKGDLTNLALAFPELTSQEFAPWVEQGKDPSAEAARARQELGHLAPNVRRWKQAADVTIFAPGKTQGGGRSVNLLPSFGPSVGSLSEQALRDRAAAVVATILSAVGHDADPMSDPANTFLTDVLADAWKSGKEFGLDSWAGVLSDPPSKYATFDGLKLDDFFPKKSRMSVARAIVGFRRQATKWLDGAPLSVESLVGTDKPKVSVFTMRHLDESERQFFGAMLLSSIVDYMFRAPASDRLRLLVVLDEAKGYLPPYPLNPPTKKPISTLLAQGRASGVGMLIGTQNPNDMDYKSLTNVGTWFLGRLRERDCARDLKAELSNRNVDADVLAGVPQRHFLVLKKDNSHSVVKTRWAYSYLRGPLSGDDLLKLDGQAAPPSVTVKPKQSVQFFYGSGDVAVDFVLASQDGKSSEVSVEHSTDNGRTWKASTLKTSFRRFASSTAGLRHVVTWDSVADLGRVSINVLVRLRIDGAVSDRFSTFAINNLAVRGGLMATLFG